MEAPQLSFVDEKKVVAPIPKKSNSYFAVIALLTLMGHYCIFSHFQIQDLRTEVSLLLQKESIDKDQIRDLMFEVKNIDDQKEVLKSQGYVSGILDGIKHEDHYMTIWHDGYNRGSEVRQQIAEAFLKREGKSSIIEVKDAPPKSE